MNAPVVSAARPAGTDVLPFEGIACPPAVVLFQTGPEDAIDKIIDRIQAEVKAEAYDVSTAKGRERCRSRAADVTRSKTLLDKMGKDLGEEHHRIWQSIGARRKKARERLEAIAAETRRPLTEWEEAEERRIEHVEQVIGFFKESAAPRYGSTIGELRDLRQRVSDVDVTHDVFRADHGRGVQARDHAYSQLSLMIEAEERRIEEAREAEEERKRLEAEAEAARAAAEAERQRIEQERAEERRRHAEEMARERAAAEEAARKDRERLAAEQAKRDAEAEAARVEAEKKAAAERARIDAEREAERQKHREEIEAAARREQERMAALQAEAEEAKRKLAEAERRQREEAEREAAAKAKAAEDGQRQKALDAAAKMINRSLPIEVKDCMALVEMIAAQRIPHLVFQPGANVGEG